MQWRKGGKDSTSGRCRSQPFTISQRQSPPEFTTNDIMVGIHNQPTAFWLLADTSTTRQGSQFGRGVWQQIVGETADLGTSNLHYNCNGFWFKLNNLPAYIHMFLSLLWNVEIGHCTIGISTTFWTSMTWIASLPQRSQTLPVLQSHTGTFGPALWLTLTSHQVGLIQHSKPFKQPYFLSAIFLRQSRWENWGLSRDTDNLSGSRYDYKWGDGK